jgi:hypothetical protein
MPLSEGTMELGSCITRVIHQDDTPTNVIIRPTCLTACSDYEPSESEDDNDIIDNLNMEHSGSREWFLYLGYMFAKLTNLTQLTFNDLDPEDEELELFWGEISGSTSLTSLNYTNMNLESSEEMLFALCAPNLTSITFQRCTIPNNIGYLLHQSELNDGLTTLCFIKCCFSNTKKIREILEFATELARLTSITSFRFTSCLLDNEQSMCLVQCLREERDDVQIHCNFRG